MASFPLRELGGRVTGTSTLTFGTLLPWVTPANGQSVNVQINPFRWCRFTSNTPSTQLR